ncbi:hypothetical protein PsorP6_013598 [Peronosclerospora sorghi]|uniref:Uncharacterized protein n=1 Tax=Peronosclerospora sorghi TaxID=230839 RepID=A0ACC0VGX4_9STRA|nr:hypothetical protein PsorP6_013598 [Peronosclerospora sorghi]
MGLRMGSFIPMLRVFNDTARYVDQGGGKRKGSFVIYLEPWHADVLEFLELRKNHGNELHLAQDPESPATLGFLKTSNPVSARRGHLAVGAKLEAATTTTGYTALHYAVKHGHITVVNSLLLNGTNVDAICTQRHSSPLHLAANQVTET